MKKNVKRRKGKIVPPGLVLLALLAAVMALAIYAIISSNAEQARTAASGAKIYFYDSVSGSLKPEARPINTEINTEMVKYVLEELSIGPKSAALTASVPNGLVESAVISGTNVNVVLTDDYFGLKSDSELVCRAAIVYTLTDLEFVDTVSFSVGDNELLKPNEQPFGKIEASDIVLNPDINPQGKTNRTLTLYFADATGTGLVSETRTILINPNESVAKYIIAELIAGPQSAGLLPTVPPETKLLEINVADGVCTVDLSKEFISRHTGDATAELLTIYSIVDSLTEQSDIKNVTFMIEGKRQEQFKTVTGFNNLYEAMDMPPAGTVQE